LLFDTGFKVLVSWIGWAVYALNSCTRSCDRSCFVISGTENNPW